MEEFFPTEYMIEKKMDKSLLEMWNIYKEFVESNKPTINDFIKRIKYRMNVNLKNKL
jgi:acyl-CoA-binding protein